MYMDALLLYAEGQEFTDTAVSTNVIDHSVAAHDLAAGEELWLVVSVAVAGANFTSLVVTLDTDSEVAFGSAVNLYTSPTIALAAITAGAQIVKAPIPAGAWERYSRVTVTFSDAGTATLDMFLTKDPDSSIKAYADGFTIS